MLDQFGAGDHPVLVVGQIGQHAEFVRRHLHRCAIDEDPRAARVDRQFATLDGRGGVTGRPAGQRAQTSQQFFGMEGLGEIVVGARVEAGDLLRPAVARRQDQHGKALAGLAPALQHRHPVHLGQAEIQHDDIIGFGIAQEMAILAIQRGVHGIAGILKGTPKLAVQVRIVFNDKRTHLFPLTFVENPPVTGIGHNIHPPAIARQDLDDVTRRSPAFELGIEHVGTGITLAHGIDHAQGRHDIALLALVARLIRRVTAPRVLVLLLHHRDRCIGIGHCGQRHQNAREGAGNYQQMSHHGPYSRGHPLNPR